MRYVADSKQWKIIDEEFEREFAFDDRNLWLGLATNEINPFSEKKSTWSTWPVLILDYNLPPWLIMKKHFVTLSLIILGKKVVTEDQFDVFLEPLVEELDQCWHDGIQVLDCADPTAKTVFTMKAMLMWTIHNFPVYGLVFGCVTKDYKACPICGLETMDPGGHRVHGSISRHSRALKKNLFTPGFRKWLSWNNVYREMESAFIGGRLRRTAS